MNKKMWLLLVVGVAVVIRFFLPVASEVLVKNFGSAEQYASVVRQQ